jgi:hypothetical protein
MNQFFLASSSSSTPNYQKPPSEPVPTSVSPLTVAERVEASKRQWFHSEKGRAAVKRRLEKAKQATKDAQEARLLREASPSYTEMIKAEDERQNERRKEHKREKNRMYQARWRAKHLGYKSRKDLGD